jgi:hypothetical protein
MGPARNGTAALLNSSTGTNNKINTPIGSNETQSWKRIPEGGG